MRESRQARERPRNGISRDVGGATADEPQPPMMFTTLISDIWITLLEQMEFGSVGHLQIDA